VQRNATQNYLTEAEEKQLWKTMTQRKGWKAVRDYVLLKTMRLLALRRTEAIRLNVGDVDGKDVLDVDKTIAAKGGIGVVHIPVELHKLFSEYLQLKRKEGEDVSADAPLFSSKKSDRLSERTVNDIVRYWCREADIPDYTPHAFRHTKAHRIMDDMRTIPADERDKKLVFANKQLRHKSMNSTLVYTAPSKEDMAKVGGI